MLAVVSESNIEYGVLDGSGVGRWYAEGLRDVEELVPMRDKTRETLPVFR